MFLPNDLRNALDNELSHISSVSLKEQAAELSSRYRSKQRSTGKSLIHSTRDVDAYAAFRMPATFAAVFSSMKKVQECLPEWTPDSLLDTGAGPGTVMWAASSLWPGLTNIKLVERDDCMVSLGKRLSKYAAYTSIQNAEWHKADITNLQSSADLMITSSSYDIVTSSYVLGEVKDEYKLHYIEKLWQMTKGVLLIIEPGTPDRFSNILKARDLLISLGASVIAPCPGNEPCPLADNNWCHFSQRVSRSRLHRQVKSADLSYEDEKFSFIAVSRMPCRSISGRVIRHPQIRKGHIILECCTPDGLHTRVVTRKEKDVYRKAKDLAWGSELPFDCFT
jgi:ribosomal protein RSM22 (predicted rRNA methylase)